MKKLYVLLLFFLSCSLFAYELNIIRTVFTPKDFYVGDMVTLHIYVGTPFDGELDQHLSTINGEWIQINSVNLVDIGPEESVIRLSFTSFAPGLRVVPDIVFGDHVLHELRIQTLSILDDQFTDLQPLAKQLVPPWTNLLVVFVLIGLVFGPYILFIVFRVLYKSMKIAVTKYKREKPFRNYYKILRKLKKEIDESSVRTFYVIVTEQLRLYLSIRFHRDFSSATTLEMDTLLRTILDADTTEELLSICRFADLVKFSHNNASKLHREKDLKSMIDIIHGLEGKERIRARI